MLLKCGEKIVDWLIDWLIDWCNEKCYYSLISGVEYGAKIFYKQKWLFGLKWQNQPKWSMGQTKCDIKNRKFAKTRNNTYHKQLSEMRIHNFFINSLLGFYNFHCNYRMANISFAHLGFLHNAVVQIHVVVTKFVCIYLSWSFHVVVTKFVCIYLSWSFHVVVTKFVCIYLSWSFHVVVTKFVCIYLSWSFHVVVTKFVCIYLSWSFHVVVTKFVCIYLSWSFCIILGRKVFLCIFQPQYSGSLSQYVV